MSTPEDTVTLSMFGRLAKPSGPLSGDNEREFGTFACELKASRCKYE